MDDQDESIDLEAKFFFNPDLLVNRINCMMQLAVVIDKLPPEKQHTLMLNAALSELLDSIQIEEMSNRFKLKKGNTDDGTRH